MKVIVVGPDSKRAKGGISSVIQAMKENRWLVEQTGMEFYPSYREGSRLFKVLYGMKQIANFSRVVDQYDLVHIHMSIKGSAERKMKYARIAKRHGKKVVIHIHGSSFLILSGAEAEQAEETAAVLADCRLRSGAVAPVEGRLGTDRGPEQLRDAAQRRLAEALPGQEQAVRVPEPRHAVSGASGRPEGDR